VCPTTEDRANVSHPTSAVVSLFIALSSNDIFSHPRNISVFVVISHFCVPDVLADYFGLPHEDIFVVTRRARQAPARRVDRLARELSNGEIKKMTIVRERFAWN
jgi:hypothetical protein